MDQTARQWILDAFRNAALGVAFIDLQRAYLTDQRKTTFRTNAAFSEALNPYEIKKFWIAMCEGKETWEKIPYPEFLKVVASNSALQFIEATPSDTDYVYTKDNGNAFHKSGPLIEDTAEMETLLFAGVTALGCVRASIIGALTKTGANIIVLKNGIGTAMSGKDYIECIIEEAERLSREEGLQYDRDNFLERLKVCETHDVIALLEKASATPRPFQ